MFLFNLICGHNYINFTSMLIALNTHYEMNLNFYNLLENDINEMFTAFYYV